MSLYLPIWKAYYKYVKDYDKYEESPYIQY